MRLYILPLFFLLVSGICAFGQSNDSLFARLNGLSNQGIDFFNVDGIEITSQTITGIFSKKNIQRQFHRYNVKEDDLQQSDSLVGWPNFYINKSEKMATGLTETTDYYFLKNPQGWTTAVTFASFDAASKNFERNFLKLIMNKQIPDSIYNPLKIDSINFSGRKIALGGSCNWMGVNNVQCPSYGQMNWSVHTTLSAAAHATDNQFQVIKAKKGGKILSEDSVAVVFEGTAVKAKRMVYDITGVNSLLVGMSGGKTLTIYFVAAPARQNFVSCVMSFWNNDVINSSGLSPLLEKVMQLTK